jgi:voltage-gated potassium channel
MNKENSTKEEKQGHGVAHRRSTVYNLFILALIVFSFVVMAGLLVGPDTSQVVYRVDVLVCVVLFADFVRNLWRAPSRAGYFFRGGGWLDLLGSIPAVPGYPWTSLFHLARLNQLVRIVRHLRGKDRDERLEETRQAPAKSALLSTTIAGFVLITIASLLALRFERGALGAEIKTGAEAFWWAVVTVTSIGYGDYVPVTPPGRFLALVLRAFGIIIFAVLITFVAESVLELRVAEEEMVKAIREENAIVRAELAELKAFLKQQGGADGDEA